MGGYLNAKAGAANYGSQAAVTKANALLAKRQAYAEAYKLEADARDAAHVAGDNMMTMRQNESTNRAAARVAGAISGFAGNNVRELSVAEYFEKAIADAARSNAVQQANARDAAVQLRRSGDSEYAMGMVQGNALEQQARIQSSYAPWVGVGGALSTLGNLGLKYNMGE